MPQKTKYEICSLCGKRSVDHVPLKLIWSVPGACVFTPVGKPTPEVPKKSQVIYKSEYQPRPGYRIEDSHCVWILVHYRKSNIWRAQSLRAGANGHMWLHEDGVRIKGPRGRRGFLTQERAEREARKLNTDRIASSVSYLQFTIPKMIKETETVIARLKAHCGQHDAAMLKKGIKL